VRSPAIGRYRVGVATGCATAVRCAAESRAHRPARQLDRVPAGRRTGTLA